MTFPMRVELGKRAQKRLAKLGTPQGPRVLRAVREYAASGRGDVRPLHAELEGLYRLRVGDWRVFFRLDEPGVLLVTDVKPRGDAYK